MQRLSLSISRRTVGKMVGLSSFAVKPGPTLLSDAGSPVCPLCEIGASDAAATISLQNRYQGGWAAPGRGQLQTEVVHPLEGVLGTSELIRSLLLTKNDAHLLLICLARGFPPEGGPQGLAGSLADGPHT